MCKTVGIYPWVPADIATRLAAPFFAGTLVAGRAEVDLGAIPLGPGGGRQTQALLALDVGHVLEDLQVRDSSRFGGVPYSLLGVSDDAEQGQVFGLQFHKRRKRNSRRTSISSMGNKWVCRAV